MRLLKLPIGKAITHDNEINDVYDLNDLKEHFKPKFTVISSRLDYNLSKLTVKELEQGFFFFKQSIKYDNIIYCEVYYLKLENASNVFQLTQEFLHKFYVIDNTQA